MSRILNRLLGTAKNDRIMTLAVEASRILKRFVVQDFRAENSIRFLGIALDWMMAVHRA